MIEFQFNRILFLALALINDDATKCEDNSDPPDEKKGIINYSHDGFEKSVELRTATRHENIDIIFSLY